MLKRSLGLGPGGRKSIGSGPISLTLSLKQSPLPPVRKPFEEELRRDVICPECNLAQAVFGLAVTCAGCGEDIFLGALGG